MSNTAIVSAPRITVINPRVPEKAKLRVAAYARVSSDSTDQLNSYLAQVDFYTKYISANEDWELVDIYADEGISGLESRKRDEFNRMIADCRAGKIDRILVKSISRFARNTKEYLQFMRELLRLGVTIQFEKENLDTGKLTSEQTAAIYGAFAQMESTNHSSNMRISVRMRMEKGIFAPSSMPYGYRLNGLDAEIVPEEAEVVRYIFDAYLNGQGQQTIADELNRQDISRGRKAKQWRRQTISIILTNMAYTGDTYWNKSFSSDTIPFPRVKNTGQRPQYYVEGTHPPIIEKKDFQRVQELLAARKEQFNQHLAPTEAVFRKHIYCGKCGSLFRKKMIGQNPYWVCRNHHTSSEQCSMPEVSETEITTAALRLQNKLKLYASLILQPMLEQLRELREKELRSNRKLQDIDKEIAHISEQNLVLVRLKSKGYVDSALYLTQTDELDRKLRELRKLRRKQLDEANDDPQIRATENMLDYLQDAPQWQDELTAEFFGTLVEQIRIVDTGQVIFKLINGLELSETMTGR